MKQMSSATKEAREKRELQELVRAILEISEKLKAAREAVRSGRLRFAAEQVRELKKALRVSGDDLVDEGEPVVYGLLRKEWSDCFDEVNHVFFLLAVFSKNVTVTVVVFELVIVVVLEEFGFGL